MGTQDGIHITIMIFEDGIRDIGIGEDEYGGKKLYKDM